MTASSLLADRSDGMSANLAQNWWAVAIRGAAAILFGIIALLMPAPTMLSLVILFGVYLIVDGIFAVASAVRAARRHERWPMLVLQAIADFTVAAVSFLWPGITVLAFVLLIAAWSIVSGIFALIAAFRLRRDHGRIWMGLGAVLSIIFGVLVGGAPLIGAVVVTWWIGAYALVLGVSLLVLAFQLRSHRTDQLSTALPAGV